MEKLSRILPAAAFILFTPIMAFAQTDSLILSNGNDIVGEIKSMDKGVLTIETPYSDNDFNIKWGEIKELYSTTRFLITLQDGRRMNSSITSAGPGEVALTDEDGIPITTAFSNVVFLKGVKSDFWSRVNANVDLGITFTKDNNLKQYNFFSAVGYTADKWSLDLFYDDTRSTQDSVANTKRNEGGINFKYFLARDWFITPEVTYLSNTEQAIKARITTKLGAGRYMIHTNRSYWGLLGGVNLNSESFTNDTESRSSTELFAATEVDLFDIGDLSLLSNLYVYPSLTESGRLRSDFRIDTKYEFAADFYVKVNFTANYDNRPAVIGKELDYVFGISFGWEL